MKLSPFSRLSWSPKTAGQNSDIRFQKNQKILDIIALQKSQKNDKILQNSP
jgi:hypothetical protein